MPNYPLKTMGCHRPRPHQNFASTWWLPKLATVAHNAIGVANSYTIFGVTFHSVLPPYTPVQYGFVMKVDFQLGPVELEFVSENYEIGNTTVSQTSTKFSWNQTSFLNQG
jgi:hypothetical protein